jgi:hypothetical protein
MNNFTKWIRDLPEGIQILLFLLVFPIVVASAAFIVFLIISLWHFLYLRWW